MSRRHDWVCWDRVFLPRFTWLDKTFESLLNFLPNTCELANWSLPLSFSPSLLGNMLVQMASSSSLASSSTLSSVLVTKHNLSPDCLKSSWTPRTLQRVLKSNSLLLDILHPSSEKRESTQNSTCLDSLLLARQRKSSKYTDHSRWRRVDPTFHSARETRRKAVTEAMDPKGRTHCLKIFADEQPGSYTAKYESRCIRQGNLLISVWQVPALSYQTIFSTQRPTPHPKGNHERYVVNGVYGDSFVLGDGEVDQGCLVVVNRSHLVFLLHRKTLRESRSSRELLFVYRPLDETFFHFLQSSCEEAQANFLASWTLHWFQENFRTKVGNFPEIFTGHAGRSELRVENSWSWQNALQIETTFDVFDQACVLMTCLL